MDFASSLITPVILCGGFSSDTLNEAERPKPFRKLSGNLSRFQQALLRVSDPGQFNAPLIVADKAHHSLIEFELDSIGAGFAGLVLEPVGRGSAPSLAFAALLAGAYNFTGSLLVMPCDHLVRDPGGLMSAIDRGMAAADHDAIIAFGREVKHGDEPHAWMQKGAPLSEDGADQQNEANVFRTERFISKSEEKDIDAFTSEAEFFRSSGMYLFSLSSILKELCAHAPEVLTACQQALIHANTEGHVLTPSEDKLAACPSLSIEAAIMEKTSRGAMVPTSALWVEDGPRPYLPREFAQPEVNLPELRRSEAKPSVIERIEAVQHVLDFPDASQPEFDFAASTEPKVAAEEGPDNVLLKDVSNAHVQSNGPLTVVAGLSDVIVINVGEAVVAVARSHVPELLEEQTKLRSELLEGGDVSRVLPESVLALLQLVVADTAEGAADEEVAEHDGADPALQTADTHEDVPLFVEDELEEPPLLLHAEMESAA